MATPKPIGVCQGRGKPSTTPNNSTRVVGGAKRPFGNLVGGVEGVVSDCTTHHTASQAVENKMCGLEWDGRWETEKKLSALTTLARAECRVVCACTS